DRIIHTIYSGISDLYYQIGIISVSGHTYKWFIENFDHKKIINIEHNFVNDEFKNKIIEDEIKHNDLKVDILENKQHSNIIASTKFTSTKDLFFIPHIGGRLSPSQPYFKGAFIGIDWDHNLGSFYLSILEANGYELYYILGHIKKLNSLSSDYFSEIKVIGGGSQNNIENKIKANILNLKYIVPKKIPFEIVGDFLIAKYKDRVREGYKELEDSGVFCVESIIKPDYNRVKYYSEKKEKYKKIIEKLDRLFFEISNPRN
ncbi:MAG: hypothetical protein H5T85_07340, partial [Actinobacteria bacterium]|nr:hypothetical protein [Actinomycetota bacterium]